MAFLVLGINHKTAPIELREQLAVAPEQQADLLQALCAQTSACEAAILSTCNRTELYVVQEKEDSASVLLWLAQRQHMPMSAVQSAAYTHHNEQAAQHMIRVAAGLDSLILGEPQILGQMKAALALARTAGTVGPTLERVVQVVLSTTKAIRTDTGIGDNPISVAFVAVNLAKQIFSDLQHSQALLIGAGETITLVARHLHEQGVQRIVVANRTLERASILAEPFGAQAIVLADLGRFLPESDIVISSTASTVPILGKGTVERALKQRRHKPMFMVDLAVPRDIEPEVSDLSDVYLYGIDDLYEVVSENLKSRQSAAVLAEQLVDSGARTLMQRLREQAAVEVLRAYRTQSEELRDQELARALRLLRRGAAAEDVLQQLAHGLTSKLLHQPSVQLKRFSAANRLDALAIATELLAPQQLIVLDDCSDENLTTQ